MNKIAIFVDAGYLYGTGSEVLFSDRQPRSALHLHFSGLVNFLTQLATQVSKAEVLRTYWYDFSVVNLPIIDNVKLRSGFEPGERISGQIAVDLGKLTRNQAISDALILAGDDELRTAVVQAQEYGVRVHLLSLWSLIDSRPGKFSLRGEADTRRTIDAAALAPYLVKKTDAPIPGVAEDGSELHPEETATAAPEEVLVAHVREHLSELYSDALEKLAELGPREPLPRDLDGPLLVGVKRALGRPLFESEKRILRDLAKRLARGDHGQPAHAVSEFDPH